MSAILMLQDGPTMISKLRLGMLFLVIGLTAHGDGGQSVAHSSPLSAHLPPTIANLVKPSVLKKITNDNDVISYARLGDLEPGQGPLVDPIRKYSYYAVMLVRQSLSITRRTLMDYKLYPKMISYIDRAEFSEASKILQIEGGIWKYKLISSVLFEEKSERWIHYSIVGGHFLGLKGDLFFESLGEKGTLVYLRGEILGQKWPPKFVIELGAEIIFSFAGKKMRSFIEAEKRSAKKSAEEGVVHDPEIPQPKRRF